MEKLTVPQIAKVCYEVNRGYCQALGDNSQVPWLQVSDQQKEDLILAVNRCLARSNYTPQDSHNAWLKARRMCGWKQGPVKDCDARIHPCMVEFDDLPPVQKAKDYIFIAIAHALA